VLTKQNDCHKVTLSERSRTQHFEVIKPTQYNTVKTSTGLLRHQKWSSLPMWSLWLSMLFTLPAWSAKIRDDSIGARKAIPHSEAWHPMAPSKMY